MDTENRLHVAIIGAGPAGLFAAQKLASLGYGVALFNRDIKPGGLVEYGIFLEKHKIKNGFRAQFQQILDSENISYFGNVTIGKRGIFGIQELIRWGFDAVLVTCGAQGTKLINLPGENLKGVYHAKDLVYHYNQLPPFSKKSFPIGKKVAIVGAGNVMTDIAHYLINYCNVEEIVVIIRRGPAEVKFDQKEVLPIIAHLDLDDFKKEIQRVSAAMRAIGQDPEAAEHKVLVTLEKACPIEHSGKIIFRFLQSPDNIMLNKNKDTKAITLLVEHNALNLKDGNVTAQGTGNFSTIYVDNIIFAIGDSVSDEFGLPMKHDRIVESKKPEFPIESISFEIGSPATGESLPGLFFAGWARNPSTGLAGIARRDGVFAAEAIHQYLQSKEQLITANSAELQQRMEELGLCYVTRDKLRLLEAAEKEQAEKNGLEAFKFSTNEEMLTAMGLPVCKQD